MKRNCFRNVRILDNFYQTSSFFPMPVVLVCTLNFIPDDRKYMRNCVMLGYPGETTEEKMVNSIFSLLLSQRSDEERKPDTRYPDIVAEALQVFECSLDSFEIDEQTHAQRSILNIDKVLLKEKWYRVLVEERKSLPNLPIDYGFRNNAHFWFTRHSPPYREPIPKSKATSVDSVMWAITRGGFAEELTWSEEAAAKLVAIPRVFLNLALRGIEEEARRAGVAEITPEFLDTVRDKRAREKGR
jgi:hypothetical protein